MVVAPTLCVEIMAETEEEAEAKQPLLVGLATPHRELQVVAGPPLLAVAVAAAVAQEPLVPPQIVPALALVEMVWQAP